MDREIKPQNFGDRTGNYIITLTCNTVMTCIYFRFNSGYTEIATYKGHKNYVSSVCFLDPTEEHPNGLIVTGGNDSQICVYHPDYLEPTITAKVHTNTGRYR